MIQVRPPGQPATLDGYDRDWPRPPVTALKSGTVGAIASPMYLGSSLRAEGGSCGAPATSGSGTVTENALADREAAPRSE